METYFMELDPTLSAKEILKRANAYYQKLPKDEEALLALCETLLKVTPA